MPAYQPDRSLKGKLRRRLVRLQSRRPAPGAPFRPMVTFAFDDPPASATMAGAEILARHGALGVYFVSSGLLGEIGPMGRYAGWDDVQRIAKAGHEVACHTYSHLDCGQASGTSVDQDAARNQSAFAAHGLPPARTFAYPYGDVSLGAKRALSNRYGLLRALHHGLIEPGSDLNQAPAVGIEGPEGEAVARNWLGRAAQRSAWLILYTHDVQDTPSQWGCTAGALERLVIEARRMGMDIVTATQGLRRLSGHS